MPQRSGRSKPFKQGKMFQKSMAHWRFWQTQAFVGTIMHLHPVAIR